MLCRFKAVFAWLFGCKSICWEDKHRILDLLLTFPEELSLLEAINQQ